MPAASLAAASIVQRCTLGLALTAGLAAFGVRFTGLEVRAASLLQPAWRGSLDPLPGSRARPDTVLLEGQPTQVLACEDERSARQVFQRYRRQAVAAATAARPFVELDHGAQGGVLAWVSPASRRVGVIVEATPDGGCRYRLLESAPANALAGLGLPAGLATPAGCHVVSSVQRPDGTGSALLLSQGGVQDTASQLRVQLEDHGFLVDRAAARALEAAQPDTDRLALPFAADGRRGLLIVATDGEQVRVSLTVDEG